MILSKVDWQPIRDSFIKDSPRPTYAELAEKFGVNEGTIIRRSSTDGWLAAREAHMEQLDKQNGLRDIVREAAQRVSPVTEQLGEFASSILESMTNFLGSIEKSDTSLSQRANMYQTLSFAVLNTANAMKTVGLLGLAGNVKEVAGERGLGSPNGQWNKGLLAQLNVTIQSMGGKPGDTAPAVSVQAAEAKPAETVSGSQT